MYKLPKKKQLNIIEIKGGAFGYKYYYLGEKIRVKYGYNFTYLGVTYMLQRKRRFLWKNTACSYAHKHKKDSLRDIFYYLLWYEKNRVELRSQF